jgi:hypothetical protein
MARWLIPCTVFVLAAAAWWLHQRSSSANRVEAVAALVERCAVQMLNDTCRVTNGTNNGTSGAAPATGASRLFIAGVGEVDGNAYAQMQSWGKTMCENVRQECQTAWDGSACTIAKALYPLLPQ